MIFTKHIYTFFLFLSLITIISPLSSRIADKRDLRGLYDAVIEEKKYLSPFHGFIWVESGLLEKYYVWGNATVELDANGVVKKVISADNTMRLILSLFHRVPGQFGRTTLKNNPASYLTPESIGKMVAAIDRYEGKTEKEAAALQKELVTIFMNILPTAHSMQNSEKILVDIANKTMQLLQNPSIQQLQNNKKTKQYFNFTKSQWKKSLQNLSKLSNEQIRKLFDSITAEDKEQLANLVAEYVENFKNSTASLDSITKEFNVLKSSVTNIAKYMVESLKECGSIIRTSQKDPSYPPYTTQMILLSFLYDAAARKDDFLIYFKQFSPAIIHPEEGYFEGQLDHTLDITSQARGMRNNIESYIMYQFEQLAYEAIYNLGSLLPPKIRDSRVSIKGCEFIDCGEATIMTLLRVLVAKMGAYDFSKSLFIADDLPSKISQFFTTNNIPFNAAKMQENILPFQNFLQKYSNATIVDGFSINQTLTDISSDLPGIKYLQKIKNDGSAPAYKDSREPMLHPLPGKTYGEEFGNHELVDDQYTLFELAGYPSSFITIVNHFFGTNFTSFSELCTAFDFALTGDVQIADDKNIWVTYFEQNIEKVPKVTMHSIINNTPITLTISLSTGHTNLEFVDTNKSFDRHEPMLDHLLPLITSDISIQNLTACYPYAKEQIEIRLNVSKTVLDSAYLLFVALSSNIKKSKVQGEFLYTSIMHNEFEPNKFLNVTSEKMLASFIVSPNLYLIGEIISAFAKKEHILSEHSLTLMEKLLSCFPPDSKKKQTLKGLVYPDVLKFIVNHHWEQFATDSHFVSILDTVTTWLNSQPIDVQQAIIIESLTSSELQTIPDSLIPCLKLALEGELFPRTNKVNYLQVLHHTKTDFFTPEEKEKKIQSILSNMFKHNAWSTETEIIEADASFLFPLLFTLLHQSKFMEDFGSFHDAGILLLKLINKNITPGTSLYSITEEIANKLFNVQYITTYLSEPDMSEFLAHTIISATKEIIEYQKTLFFPFIKTFFASGIEKFLATDTSKTLTDLIRESEDIRAFQNCYANIIDNMLSFYNKAESLDAQTTPLIKTCLTSFFTFCITKPYENILVKMHRIIATKMTNSQLYESLNPLSNLFYTQIQIRKEKIEKLEAEDPTNYDLKTLRTEKKLLEKKKEPILRAVKKALES